jgi:hypothetical protein
MSSGKQRKFGRGRRSPSAKRYLAENRAEKNRRRKAAKIARRATKVLRVPHGTARAKRRARAA